MKIIAHTPYGVFESLEATYDSQKFEKLEEPLKKLPGAPFFTFSTTKGEIYFTPEMINQSLFILE